MCVRGCGKDSEHFRGLLPDENVSVTGSLGRGVVDDRVTVDVYTTTPFSLFAREEPVDLELTSKTRKFELNSSRTKNISR